RHAPDRPGGRSGRAARPDREGARSGPTVALGHARRSRTDTGGKHTFATKWTTVVEGDKLVKTNGQTAVIEGDQHMRTNRQTPRFLIAALAVAALALVVRAAPPVGAAGLTICVAL